MSPPPDALLRRGHWTGWRPTVEGRYWLGIVAIFLVVAIAKNINLLALLGFVMLAVSVLAAIAAGGRLRHLEARRIVPENVFAEASARLEIRLHNRSSQIIEGVRLEDLGESHGIDWFFDQLEGGVRRAASTEVVLPRRGWYEFAPLSASSSYPFGLWKRRVVVGPPLRIIVLPRKGKILLDRLRHHLRGADPRGERIHRHGWRHEAAQADFHGLRPFRTGDSPRWIHWRTSARRGELMVREFEDVPGDDLVMVLDTLTAPNELDAVVSLAATIVAEWSQRRGDRLTLAISGERPELLDGVTGPEHARRVLEHLALLAPSEIAGGVLELLADRVPGSASVVVVAASESPLADELETVVHRPVTLLTPSQLHHAGVYTPP